MSKRTSVGLAVGSALMLTVATIWASPAFDGDFLTKYKGGIDTPNTPQANPFAGGKPRVLFIVGRDQGQGQEVREIVQRADFDFDVFFCAHYNAIGGEGRYYSQARGVTGPEKEAALLDKLDQHWDAIVLGSVEFNTLPDSCKYRLFKLQQEGTGFVAVRYRKDFELFAGNGAVDLDAVRRIRQGIPFTGLFSWTTGWYGNRTRQWATPLSTTDLVTGAKDKTYPAGAPFELAMLNNLVLARQEGVKRFVSIDDGLPRMYWISLGCFFGDSVCNDLSSRLAFRKELDAEAGLFIRAIHWAAGLTPSAQFDGMPADTLHLESGKSTNLVLQVKTAQAESVAGLTASWALTDKLGRAGAFGAIALHEGESAVAVPLPALPAGGHFLRVTLRNAKDAVEDWGHIFIEATSSVPFGPIVFDHAFFERQDSATGHVAAPDGATVRVLLLDFWGREIASGLFLSREGKASFSLPLHATRSMRIAAVAERVNAGGTAEAFMAADFYVPQFVTNDFMTTLWPSIATPDLVHMTQRETLSEALGVNAEVIGNFGTLSNVNNAWREHYINRILKDVFDPEGRAAVMKTIRESAATARQYSRRTHLVGDEVPVNTEITEHATEAWRTWLRAEYGNDIAALNAVWQAAYEEFDAIEVFASEAVEQYAKENFPRYLDYRRFREVAVADFIDEVRRETNLKSPETLTGLQYLNIDKNDAEYLISTMDCLSAHSPSSLGLKLMRDMARPGAVVGGWTGGYFNQRPYHRRLLWTNLLNGFNSLWLFIESGGEGMLAADGRIAEHMQWVLPDYRAINEGLGTFVTRAVRQNSGIAMLHDFRSVVCSEQVSTFGDAIGSHLILDRILNDNGMQYRYIGPRALAQGVLKDHAYHTLILPFACALTAEEVDAVRAFVKNGGTLLADVLPAVFDAHGRAVPDGALADVFGVKQNNLSELVRGPVVSTAGLDLPFAIALSGVEATTATSSASVEGTPVCFENRYGKGVARLLNFTPFSYTDLVEAGQERSVTIAMGNLVGAVPVARLLDASDKLQSGIEVLNVFELEGRQLLGILPTKNLEQGSIALDKTYFVHDLRTGMDFGRTDKIPLKQVKADEPLLFGLSNVKISGIEAHLDKVPARGETVNLTIRLKGREKGSDVVHVALVGPDGKRCPWFSGSETLKQGRATLRLEIAANEKVGNYQLIVTDVLSGLTSTLDFKL